MISKLNLNKYTDKDYYIADLCSEKPFSAKEHSHDFYEIFIIVSGEFIEKTEQGTNTYHKGDIRFISPDTIHSVNVTGKKSNNHLINIAIDKSQINEEVKGIFDYKESFFIPQDRQSTLGYKIEKVIKLNDNVAIRQMIIKNIVDDILISVYFDIKQGAFVPLWLKKLHDKMSQQENFLAGTSRFVELSGVTHSHLCREFHKYYDMTPVEYININKINYSARLLRQTDRKIIDIAVESGFDNLSNFNRLFREYYNITPSLYRKRNRLIFR